MKKTSLLLFILVINFSCQKTIKNTASIDPAIDSLLVKKHLYTLASDKMQGRKAGTPGIEKAASYIETEFKKIGLTFYDTLNSYRQTFTIKSKQGNKDITTSNIIGVIEGKSKKEEYVIISAHYDHLGINGVLEDSIFNGANDKLNILKKKN